MHRMYAHSKLGPKNNNWKGGISADKWRHQLKYIHVVPDQLKEVLLKLSENPDLMHSSDEIVLLDARIADLLSQLEHGSSSSIIKESKEMLDSVFSAVKDGDPERVSVTLNRLREIIHSGDEEADEIWKQIHETMEQRRRLIDTGRKVMDSEEMSLRADKLLIIASEIGRIARKYIKADDQEQFMLEFRGIFLPKGHPVAEKIIDLK
jgi:hypothetical protein